MEIIILAISGTLFVYPRAFGQIIDRSMDREKYFKKEEELKTMTKPMYAAPVSVSWCEIESDADKEGRMKTKLLRT